MEPRPHPPPSPYYLALLYLVNNAGGCPVCGCILSLQENEAKRNRADKRAADEMKARKQRELEIEEYEAKLAELRLSSAKVEERVQKSACMFLELY